MIPIYQNNDALNEHWKMMSVQILARIQKVLKTKSIRKGTKNNKKYYTLSVQLENFLRTINSEVTLKKFLHTNAAGLKQQIIWFENNMVTGIHRSKSNVKSLYCDYYILYSIFVDHGYSHENFDKLKFIKSLGIETCPYCNRNYIHALHKKGKIKPEIDHFYPKGIYPFLAASFFNLIPSCQTCNGFGGKGAEDTYTLKVTNPYLLNENDFQFDYELASLNYINPISSSDSIEITIDSNNMEPNIALFKLDQLYQKHEDHVLELIVRGQLEYSEKYREYLRTYKELSFSDAEIDRMIVGNYTSINELHKRPLSKLYRDIAKKEGLIDD